MFSEGLYLRLFLLFIRYAGYQILFISFWGVPCVSEGMYLFGSFLFYFLSFLSLSLSLVFLYLQVDLLYASASETNRLGFDSFYYKNKGRGRFVQQGGRGISNMWRKINNYKRPSELTTLLERSNTGYMNSDEMMQVRDVQNG